jgi:hypothetical protein
MQVFEVSAKTGLGMRHVFQLLRDTKSPNA